MSLYSLRENILKICLDISNSDNYIGIFPLKNSEKNKLRVVSRSFFFYIVKGIFVPCKNFRQLLQ